MHLTFDPSSERRRLPNEVWISLMPPRCSRATPWRLKTTAGDYGEVRIICFGLLAGRMVVVGYTPRGADRHIFSMRKANEREQERIGPQLGL